MTRVAMIPRRPVLVAVAALGVLSVSLSADAQQLSKVSLVGYLTPIPQPAREEAFRQELRRLGYVEGQNIAIAYRSADGGFERLPDLAATLVGLKVDVIVAVVTQATLAAKKATSTIPIVMVGASDPVRSGLVASLGRPGGNVTGTSSVATDVVGKQLELLREMLPKASRVAALWNPANPVFQKLQLGEATAAAAKLRVQLRFVEVRMPDELDRAFAEIAKERTDALVVLADPVLYVHAARIADLVTKHRLPAVGAAREFADAGGLIAYGPNYIEAYRRAATYVDRILRGTKPADLPVEQPTKFELVINAKAARALGVTIPRSLVVRADQVME
ncbi:MAG: ABC transporter substrate-binding protein [Candidatus Rokubacteria bacterium]|nr:ABC transporter substrate-binding protein [Candidatus Rokubacteria bacterium]